MTVFIIRRLLQALLVVFMMSVIVFFGVNIVGDPVYMLVSPDADQADIDGELLSFLSPAGASGRNPDSYRIPPDGISLEEVQKNFVRQALQRTGNNQTGAAKLLGLSRAKFRVLLKQLDE